MQKLEQGCTDLQPLVPDEHKTSLGKASGGFDAGESKRFLELLGKDRSQTWLRAIDPPKTRKRSGGGDHQGVASKADKAWIDAKTADGFNLYAITGNAATIKGRSVEDADISGCPALFVEWDDGADIDTQAQRWSELELPEPTLMVATGGKSVHCYWVLLEPMAPEPWRVLQSRLITYCKGDKACKNPSRLMRLPGSVYFDKKTGEPTGQCRIIAAAGHRYAAFDIETCLPSPAKPKPVAAAPKGQWEPRGIEAINAAAEYIPRRKGGEGTYEGDRNALCGCSAALAEAGHPDPDGAALALLGHLWPTETDARQVLATTTTREAKSFWAIAGQHGYDLKRTSKTVKTSARGGGTPAAATPPASIAGFIHQLPDGWVVDEETGVKKRSGLSVGHLADLLEALPQQLRFNEMTMFVEVQTTSGWVAMRDADMNSAYVLLSQKGWIVGENPVIKAICHVARHQSFHPVQQYLLNVEQDTSTAVFDLDEVAPRFFRAEDPLHVAMVRKWLIGAVWRAMEPGCQMDYCLVLQSRHQGIGKTTSFKALASPDWFNSSAPDGDKDFLLNVHSCWIFEMGELESHTGKRSAGHMKNLITITTDNFRAPYGKNNEPHRRGSVFCGTVNEDSFLRDETGNRRYWVVPIAGTEPLNREGLLAARDGIWKAAVAAYRAKELPMLTRAQEALSEIQNETFTHSDPWLEMLQAAIESNPRRWQMPFSTADVLEAAGLKQREQITRADGTRLAPLLRQLGFDKGKHVTRTGNGQRIRLWSPSQTSQPRHNLSGGGCDTPAPLQRNDSEPLSQTSQPISSKKTKGGNEQAAEPAAAPPSPACMAKQVVTVVTPPPNPLCRNGSAPSQPPQIGCDTVVTFVTPSTRQEDERRIRELRPGTVDMAAWPDDEVAELRQSLEASQSRRAAAAGIAIPEAA